MRSVRLRQYVVHGVFDCERGIVSSSIWRIGMGLLCTGTWGSEAVMTSTTGRDVLCTVLAGRGTVYRGRRTVVFAAAERSVTSRNLHPPHPLKRANLDLGTTGRSV